MQQFVSCGMSEPNEPALLVMERLLARAAPSSSSMHILLKNGTAMWPIPCYEGSIRVLSLLLMMMIASGRTDRYGLQDSPSAHKAIHPQGSYYYISCNQPLDLITIHI
jgi:hypothetical protein